MSQLMWGIFGGYSLWEYFTVILDNIPKIMYLIYASFASCLDILQALIKKLAGLDTYWVNNEAITQQDPVLEFIYGMLGMGKNKGTYTAINTVFWSLVIFAAIVLLVSTMIAIIKSHYGEDVNKTNPITYVFTAVKSIFTFMITPVAVILGIYLSQFMLQTLDNITAGSVTEESIKGIYGSAGVDACKPGDNGYYGYYDFFSLGSSTSSTTFSGMMFRAAAYDANRSRSADTAKRLERSILEPLGIFKDANGQARPNDISDLDWMAYQIDYAFMNNLHLKNGCHVNDLYSNWDDYGGKVIMSIVSVDFFSAVGYVESFSKYNVGLVWYFYNLWTFNFFVGFASISVCLGLLVSIIIGLMSRLIYSAALFMVFPPLLGLAPLDEFNAFKKWRQKFISYILMAFGSIIGMNIFFLLMPYVNEIQWFGVGLGWGIINSIINTLIIIVGLITVKQFIAFISGLIGAADAFATGDGMKGELTKTLAKTGGAVLGAGNLAMKAAGLGPLQNTLKTAAGMAVGKVRDKWQSHKINKNKLSDAEEKTAADKADRAANLMNDRRNRQDNKDNFEKSNEYKQLTAQAKAAGKDLNSDEFKEMKKQSYDAYLMKNDGTFSKAQGIVARQGFTKEQQERQAVVQKATERQKMIRQQHFIGADGKLDAGAAFRGGWKNAAADFGGAFLKAIQGGLKDLNINLGMKDGLGSILQRGTNLKVDGEGKVTGTYTNPFVYNGKGGSDRADPGQATLLGTLKSIPGMMVGAMFAPPTAPPPPKATSDDKISTAADKLSKTADALVKATEKLNRFNPK